MKNVDEKVERLLKDWNLQGSDKRVLRVQFKTLLSLIDDSDDEGEVLRRNKCSDILPKENEIVLGYLRSSLYPVIAEYKRGDFHRYIKSVGSDSLVSVCYRVDYWLPLPKYK